MPLTPYVGLSVGIHIIIIFYYKYFKKPQKKGLSSSYHESPYVRWSGYAIVVTVFAFVLFNGFILVRASVIDKHSNLRILMNSNSLPRKIFANLANAYHSQNPNSIGVVLGASTTVPGYSSQQTAAEELQALMAETECSTEYQKLSLKYNGSVTGYLVDNKLSSSLYDRQVLAGKLGIADYHGQASQNIELLNILLAQSKQATSGCSITYAYPVELFKIYKGLKKPQYVIGALVFTAVWFGIPPTTPGRNL